MIAALMALIIAACITVDAILLTLSMMRPRSWIDPIGRAVGCCLFAYHLTYGCSVAATLITGAPAP